MERRLSRQRLPGPEWAWRHAGPCGQEANDFTGSSNLFQSGGRAPWNSTNFTDVHDGLTMNDVYACNGSNNGQSWPLGPSNGGTGSNYSWNQGGAAADQRRAARTGMAFEMLAAGTALMQAGDEYLRTLQCNNNAYNLDSPANWLNYAWRMDQGNFYNFAQRLIAFRRAHPALRPMSWYTPSQVAWYQSSGASADSNYWNTAANHAIAYTIDGPLLGDSTSLYIAFNGWLDSINFTLPSPATGSSWYRVTDTCNWNDGPNSFVTPPAIGNRTLPHLGAAWSHRRMPYKPKTRRTTCLLRPQ